MADYRFAAQMISRADGRTAVGAAAYRAGVELANERNGETYDYTRKGGVLRDGAPRACPNDRRGSNDGRAGAIPCLSPAP